MDTQCTIVNTCVDISNQQSQFTTEIRTDTANLDRQLKIVSMYDHKYNDNVYYVYTLDTMY